MKRLLFTIAILSIGFYAISQENIIIISGGYSWANLSDIEYDDAPELKGTGWRINGTYEFNAKEGPISYGVSIGFISLGANYEGLGGQDVELKVSSLPIYFAPKFMFGKNKFKGFIKGALGTQSSWFKRTASGELTAASWGFYGGGGAGIMISVRENMFIKAEYEIAYASNVYYTNGWISTAMGGIGFKF